MLQEPTLPVTGPRHVGFRTQLAMALQSTVAAGCGSSSVPPAQAAPGGAEPLQVEWRQVRAQLAGEEVF